MSYYSEHREEISAKRKVRYRERREEIIAKQLAYYYENQEKRQEYARNYAREHPKRRTVEQEKAKYWRRRDRGGWFTAGDVRAQYQQQEGRCFYCGAEVGDNYHADHYIPLALGGSSTPDNCRISCPACNMSKGAKHPSELIR